MQDSERIRGTLDVTLLEMASILAEGYMRYRKGWRLARDSGGRPDDGSQAEVSEPFTEKSLDSSGH